MIDFSGPIAEGITAGLDRLREIDASDVCNIYRSIPIDSGNGLPYLGVVLRGLEMAKKKIEA